ncbi:hypothetical protein MWU59_12330 [Flavobacteriaceae bacterium F08102]|nr:hypothetical protein [Flavobacteriaceae bacterium F08102]
MHNYQSFKDIEVALKELKLKQQIDIEELKNTGYSIKEKLTFNDPLNLKSIALKLLKNFSVLVFLKKFFKKK